MVRVVVVVVMVVLMAPPEGLAECSGAVRVNVLDDLLCASPVAGEDILCVARGDASDEGDGRHVVLGCVMEEGGDGEVLIYVTSKIGEASSQVCIWWT